MLMAKSKNWRGKRIRGRARREIDITPSKPNHGTGYTSTDPCGCVYSNYFSPAPTGGMIRHKERLKRCDEHSVITDDKFAELADKIIEEDKEFLHKIGRMGASRRKI